MRYDVRPLSFGEILDRSFKILKDNFVLLTGMMAILYVPYGVIMSLLTPKAEAGVPQLPGTGMMAVGGVGLLLFLAALPLNQLAITRAVSDAYLKTPPTMGEAFRAGAKSYMPYAGTALLITLAMFGLMLLLVIPAIYFMGCWMLVGPVVMVEGTSGRPAMRRSRELVRGFWWRSCGVLTVAGIMGAVAGGGVNLVLGAVPVLGPVLSGLVQAMVGAYSAVAIVVLYVDLRCRKEDFDLQLLASQAAQRAPASAQLSGGA